MDFLYYIPLLDSFQQFRRTPGSMKHSLLSSMAAHIAPLKQGFGNFFLNTQPAERKGKFSPHSDWQNGVIQPLGSEDVYLCDAKVLIDVLVFGLINNLWEADRIGAILVDAGVQGCEIHITDFFVLSRFRVQGGSARSTPKERVSRLKRWDKFKCFEEFCEL